MTNSEVQEALVALYLRLNGYFLSGYIVHAPRGNKTEMDAIAVRFARHAEPEREVETCQRLAPPSDRLDIIVCEVKGIQRPHFNSRFRDDPAAIASVLRRIGAFEDEEIPRVCELARTILSPDSMKRASSIPRVEVYLERSLRGSSAYLRFPVFALGCDRDPAKTSPYIFADDVMRYLWRCLRSDQQRFACAPRYNFELWGPMFKTLVQYFKQPERTGPGTVPELIDAVSRRHQLALAH